MIGSILEAFGDELEARVEHTAHRGRAAGDRADARPPRRRRRPRRGARAQAARLDVRRPLVGQGARRPSRRPPRPPRRALSPADDGGRTVTSAGAIETERLALRAIAPDDIDLLVELDSDPEVMRFLNGGEPRSRAEVEDTLRRALGHRWMAFDRATEDVRRLVRHSPVGRARSRARIPAAHAPPGARGSRPKDRWRLITTAFTELGTRANLGADDDGRTRGRAP